VNGGFETAAFHESKCGGWCSSSDASLIAPWTFSGQSAYELNFGVWPAFEGKVSMDLSSTGPVTISQVVPTIIDSRYVVSFQLNDNSCGSPGTTRNGFIVATGAQPLSFGHKGGFQSQNPSNWTEVKYYFFATTAKTTVSIKSTDGSSCGPVIDRIQMAEALTATASNFKGPLSQLAVNERTIVPANFALSFDIKPFGVVSNWASIIHYTQDNSNIGPKGRIPGMSFKNNNKLIGLAIWFKPGTTKLHVRVATATNTNDGIGASIASLPLNATTNVRVEAFGRDVLLYLNNTLDSKVTVSADRISGAATLYISDPWYTPASASFGSYQMKSITALTATECKLLL
jgi:hypothetical protein